MRKSVIFLLVMVFAVMIFAAGCSDSGSTQPSETQTTAAPTPFAEQTAVATEMVPGPTEQPPAKYLVDVQVDKDIVYGTITATFRGGLGQTFVSAITVDVYYPDGTHESKQLSAENVGDTVEFKGNKDQKDRVKATVVYDGSLGTYVIYDQLVPEKLPTTMS